MRHPLTGKRLPTSWLPAEVSGERNLATGPAQSSDDAPPAVSSRKARRP